MQTRLGLQELRRPGRGQMLEKRLDGVSRALLTQRLGCAFFSSSQALLELLVSHAASSVIRVEAPLRARHGPVVSEPWRGIRGSDTLAPNSQRLGPTASAARDRAARLGTARTRGCLAAQPFSKQTRRTRACASIDDGGHGEPARALLLLSLVECGRCGQDSS